VNPKKAVLKKRREATRGAALRRISRGGKAAGQKENPSPTCLRHHSPGGEHKEQRRRFSEGPISIISGITMGGGGDHSGLQAMQEEITSPVRMRNAAKTSTLKSKGNSASRGKGTVFVKGSIPTMYRTYQGKESFTSRLEKTDLPRGWRRVVLLLVLEIAKHNN